MARADAPPNNRPTDGPHLLMDPNLHVIFGVTLMAVLGVASITPALPVVATAFERSPREVGWLVAAFTLPGVGLTPVLGVLGDRIGRKRVLVPSLLLFAVAGTACALSQRFEVLVALRFLQGVGAASLGVLNVTLIGDLYRGARRPLAFGYNATVLSVGTALYPAIGGALTMLGWQYPFLLPMLGVAVAALVLWVLDSRHTPASAPLQDYFRRALRSAMQPVMLGLFLAGLIIFVVMYGAYLTYLPFLLHRDFNASPVLIGVTLASASVTTGLVASQLGRLANRYTERRLILFGFGCYILTMLWIPAAGSLALLFGAVLLQGAANGITIPSQLSALTAQAPEEHRAALVAVNGALFRLGQTLGPVLAGVVLQWRGIGAVFTGTAMLAVVTWVVLLALLRPGRWTPQPS